ncbi:MAG TPA: type II toxin-antitoxin system VapC family toxin [Thermoanaerobaculia bacterium]|nr:type II toxin-antitoxin system VapC family toxin [Thermoanaerobaculia bacterium]
MIIVDTSALVDSLTGSRKSLATLRELIVAGERLVVPALVMYEWLRGPRRDADLSAQEQLLPAEDALPFTAREAAVAAEIYRTVRSPRGRGIDIAIAATALVYSARLWTLRRADFDDIPGLVLV